MIPDKHTKPDFDKVALLTIDIQRDFLDGRPFGVPGTEAVLPNVRLLLGYFRETGRPVVHIVRLYRPDGRDADLCRRALLEDGARIVLPGSKGSELPEQLLPHPSAKLDADRLMRGDIQFWSENEAVIFKPRWGAFYRTPLEDHLRGLGVSTLIFTGCNFPNCPRTSIYEAGERDFKIVAVRDGLSELCARGMEELRRTGVGFRYASDLLNDFHQEDANGSAHPKQEAVLETRRLRIRPFTSGDTDAVLKYRRLPEVAAYQLFEPFDRRAAEAFIETYKDGRIDTCAACAGFALIAKETGQFIGDCAVKFPDGGGSQAEVGITLDPEVQGRGYATEALSGLITHLFETLPVHRVFAVTDCENDGANTLLKRLGFRREAHLHENIWFKGRWGDEFIHAVLKDEWKRPVQDE